MKNILSMLKSRWMIIVLGIIAVAALPALWFVSSGMASETVKKFQERVEKDYKEVTASKVSYEVVSPTGEKILQKSADANHAMIEAYKAIGEELRARTDVVSKAATDLNTHDGNHKLLIEGLFPAPPQLEKESKPKDFARALLRTERPRLLGLIKAGMPPPPTVRRGTASPVASGRYSRGVTPWNASVSAPIPPPIDPQANRCEAADEVGGAMRGEVGGGCRAAQMQGGRRGRERRRTSCPS